MRFTHSRVCKKIKKKLRTFWLPATRLITYRVSYRSALGILKPASCIRPYFLFLSFLLFFFLPPTRLLCALPIAVFNNPPVLLGVLNSATGVHFQRLIFYVPSRRCAFFFFFPGEMKLSFAESKVITPIVP